MTSDEFSYSAIISACEKGGVWALALSILSAMPRMRVTLDEISYRAVIRAGGKGGK